MIILLVSAVVLIGFIVLFRRGLSENWNAVGLLGAALTGLWIVILLTTLPISRTNGYDQLARLKAFRESVQRARADKSLSEIERAAILTQIVNWNEWLASERYWKGGLWDWWHVGEVLTTEDLK